jgi:hypothetical protein
MVDKALRRGGRPDFFEVQEIFAWGSVRTEQHGGPAEI